MHETPLTGLVLSGGGARAAYQVGVLRVLCQLRREAQGQQASASNPFGIIVGTSAGAINGAALACQADRFDAAVDGLYEVWRNFHADQVYRTDSLGVLHNGARWLTMMSVGWAIARWRKWRPRSLLNNTPLAGLLQQLVPMERLPSMLARKHLHAFAVTASNYNSGEHVTFYNSTQAIKPWLRSNRLAVPAMLVHEHLMASAAIPFIFPAIRLHHDGAAAWYGDGSMRQTAPLSPAIHLGAQRLLIIGAGRMHEPKVAKPNDATYPTLAQVAGHAMSSIFLDALSVDIERLERINRTMALLPAAAQTTLRPIQTLVLAPSQRLDDIAARHVDSLPGSIRLLLRGAGVGHTEGPVQGAALASYLLFEASYTRELLALGEADTWAKKAEVLQFFNWQPNESASVPVATPLALADR